MKKPHACFKKGKCICTDSSSCETCKYYYPLLAHFNKGGW